MADNKFLAAKMERAFNERVAILAVPYQERERASALGALWYKPLRVWFVPKGVSVDGFKEWNPSTHTLGQSATREMMLDSFVELMTTLGLDTSKALCDDGKWHYVPVVTKNKKNEAGAYFVDLKGGFNGGAFGYVINNHTGERESWKYDGPLLTPEQRARLRAEALAKDTTAKADMAKQQDTAASHAREIFAIAGPAQGHGYLVKKGIGGEGLRQIAGAELLKYSEFHSESGGSVIRAREHYLLVPMANSKGEIRAVQAINRDGSVKCFMRGAQKKGTMAVIGAESFDAVMNSDARWVAFGEGFATGASFRSGAGVPVVVCFDAGNLESVVGQTAGQIAAAGKEIIVAADNDQFHVERAMELLAERVGVNTREGAGQQLSVRSGASAMREVNVGEVLTDGQWHEAPKGTYCVTLEYEKGGGAVEKLVVEVVPSGGRKLRMSFENRGMEAGRSALKLLEGSGGAGLLVCPEFASLADRPTDWNDLHKREGVRAMRDVLAQYGVMVLEGRSAGNHIEALCQKESSAQLAR